MRESIAAVMRLLILPLLVSAPCVVNQASAKTGYASSTTYASSNTYPSSTTAEATRPKAAFKIGDAVPATRPESMIQGEPVMEFKPGEVYIFEFWATWCGTCVEAILYLDALHRKMGPKGVIITGVNVWEYEKDPSKLGKIREFVKSQGEKMTYRVAVGGQAFVNDWLANDGVDGIPHAFIVKDGKIAWQGHPFKINEELLDDVISGQYAAKVANCPVRAANPYYLAIPTKIGIGDIDLLLERFEDPSNWSRYFKRNYHQLFKAACEAMAANDWQKVEAALKFIPANERLDVAAHIQAHQANQKGDPSQLIQLKRRCAEQHWHDWKYLATLATDIVEHSDCPHGRGQLKLAKELCERALEITEISRELRPRLLETYARLHCLLGDKEKAMTFQERAINELKKSIDRSVLESAELKSQLDYYSKGKTPPSR